MTAFERKMRKKIERELAEVNRRYVALKKEPRSTELEGFGDNTPITEEIESIQIGEEREISMGVMSQLLDRAAALDEALHRIDQGVYGICVSCLEPIPRPRLEAVPEAALCAPCQEKKEATRKRVEPRPTEWKSAEKVYEEKGGFDAEGFETHLPRPENFEGETLGSREIKSVK